MLSRSKENSMGKFNKRLEIARITHISRGNLGLLEVINHGRGESKKSCGKTGGTVLGG
jgi:hypothetical protein